MTTPTPRRRARTRAVTAAVATAVVLVLATASPAGAATVSGGPTWSDGQVVTVSGDNTAHPTATHVTISQCDVTPPVIPGTRCSSTSATSFVALTPGSPSTFSSSFTLDQAWTLSWNYTVNPPTSSFTPVSCRSLGTRSCAVIVSYYSSPNYPAPPITQVSHDIVPVKYA